MSSFDDEVNRHQAKLDAELAAEHPALARRRSSSPFSLVSLGASDVLGEDLTVDEETRLAHSHTIGTTGAGKTNYLAHLIKQDIDRGRGVLLLDPHGGDPHSPLASESLFSTIVDHCARRRLIEAGRVHIIDPSRTTHAAGFNPLAPRPGFKPDVIADAMLQCVERVWEEDTHEKPSTRSVLRATFIALSELGLTLNEAALLLDLHDVQGLRQYALTKVQDPYARETLSYLHDLSQQRNKNEFLIETKGPRNRLNEFASNAAIRAIIGQTKNLIDLVNIMDQGHVLLVNLQSTGESFDSHMKLLGTMLLRYLFALAPRRTNRIPFFVYVDECQEFLSGDIPRLLAEVRKRRIGVHLAHQFMQQLHTDDETMLASVTGCTQVKTIFRMTDATEARDLADRFTPAIDYEMPVKILVKPTVVGHEIMWLENEGTQHGLTETQGETVTDTVGQSKSVGQAETFSQQHAVTDATGEGTSESDMFGEGAGFGSSDGISQSIIPDTSLFGMNNLPTTIGTPTQNTMSISGQSGSSNSRFSNRGRARGTSKQTSHAESFGTGYARSFIVANTESVSRAVGRQHSTAVSNTDSKGRSQALLPILKDLPTAVYSRDDVLDMIARDIIRLPIGEALVTIPGRATRITVPLVKTPTVSPTELTQTITRALEASRYASPIPEVHAQQDARTANWRDSAAESRDAGPAEPDDWAERYADPGNVQDILNRMKNPTPPTGSKPRLVVDNEKGDDDPPPAA